MNYERGNSPLVLIIGVLVIGLALIFYYFGSNKFIIFPTQPSKPKDNVTSIKPNQATELTSYKTQKIIDFSFEYPSEWNSGIDRNHTFATLSSQDLTTAMSGVLSSGIQVEVGELDKQQTFISGGTGTTSFQSLDQVENNLRYTQMYSEIKRIKVSNLDALSYKGEFSTQAGPILKNYYIVIVKNDNVFTLYCSFNKSNAPANADMTCQKIITSITTN